MKDCLLSFGTNNFPELLVRGPGSNIGKGRTLDILILDLIMQACAEKNTHSKLLETDITIIKRYTIILQNI